MHAKAGGTDPVPWRDEIAHAMRMKLLMNLDIDKESSVFVNVQHDFPRSERELILAQRTSFARAKTFLDFLCSRLNTAAFTVFLSALDESLRAEVCEAYIRAGGNKNDVEKV